MVTRKNDEAVSPVIGVILMVAITVILAAVIAAFVFGMSGNISKTKTVAITVQKADSSTIVVMNNGGQDAATLVKLVATTVPAATGCNVVAGNNITFVAPDCIFTAVPVPVGGNMRLTSAAAYNVRTSIIAVGTFNDGSNQVLLDTFV
jgi:flagellin-like protein